MQYNDSIGRLMVYNETCVNTLTQATYAHDNASVFFEAVCKADPGVTPHFEVTYRDENGTIKFYLNASSSDWMFSDMCVGKSNIQTSKRKTKPIFSAVLGRSLLQQWHVSLERNS